MSDYMTTLMSAVTELRKLKAAHNVPNSAETSVYLRVTQELLDEVNRQDKAAGLPGNTTLPELQDLLERFLEQRSHAP